MALPKKTRLPTHLDLPCEDGIPMEDRFHQVNAADYLKKPLQTWLEKTGWPAVLGSNCFVYYELKGSPVGPDFFVVNGGVERGQRSWVVWDEGNLTPTLIVEMVSKSSGHKDRTTNFRIYQDVFGTPDYFIYDVRRREVEAFCLENGVYVAARPDADGLYPCRSLPLKLGIRGQWLRWFHTDGTLLMTGDEQAEAERRRAEAERTRADTERTRADTELRRAEAEQARADAAELRLKELERRLRDLEFPPS